MARACIACRVDARLAIERVNFQTRIVAEAIITVMLLDKFGLHTGIAFDGVGCFGNILVAAHVGQSEYFIAVAKHLP